MRLPMARNIGASRQRGLLSVVGQVSVYGRRMFEEDQKPV